MGLAIAPGGQPPAAAQWLNVHTLWLSRSLEKSAVTDYRSASGERVTDGPSKVAVSG